MGMSLVRSRELSSLYENMEQFVEINNTSNIELNIMRPEMIASGLESIRHNINRRQLDLQLFEFGKSYLRKDEQSFTETRGLTLYLTGNNPGNWQRTGRQRDYYQLKADVETILHRLGISSYQRSESEEMVLDYGMNYHRGPQVMAYFGALSRKYRDAYQIDTDVYVAWLNWDLIQAFAKKHEVKIVAPSKYPSVQRDLSLKISDGVKFAELEQIARKQGKPLLSEISLFDVYVSDEMKAQGEKSYAINFTFQSADKTLKDKEIDKVMNKIMSTFERQLQAQIRK